MYLAEVIDAMVWIGDRFFPVVDALNPEWPASLRRWLTACDQGPVLPPKKRRSSTSCGQGTNDSKQDAALVPCHPAFVCIDL